MKPSLLIWKALIILLIGLILTVFVSYLIYVDEEKRTEKEFSLVCEEIKTKIETRLHAHAQLLRSGAAYFNASDTVTRINWSEFIKQNKININLPGIQGVGFSLIIPKSQLEQHTQRIRNEGFPQYTVHPTNDRSEYTSIIYLEPFDYRNQRAFGYDMFSQSVRREAMEQSRDFDVAALTGKVLLVQETDDDLQAGTLMYVPVYKNNEQVGNIQQRRDAIIGWVYSPYRMNDLMDGMLGSWGSDSNKIINLIVYDGDSINDNAMIFDSYKENNKKGNRFSTNIVSLDFNGRKWTLYFTQSKEQIKYSSKIAIVPFAGVAISFLLSLLLFAFLNTKKAKLMAEGLTVNLSARNKELIKSKEQIEGSAAELVIANETLKFENEEKEKRAAEFVIANETLKFENEEKEKRAAELVIANKELVLSERKYSSLFSHMLEGFALHEIICDTNGKPVDYRFLDINPAFELLTGLKKSEIIGKTVLTVIPDTESFWIERYGVVALTGNSIDFENYSAQLNRYYQIMAFSPAKNQFAVMFYDITKRKQAEEKLKITFQNLERSNNDLEQFAYVANHDLQEPLRMISSYTQLLERKYKDKLDRDANDYIRFVVDGAIRMQKLLNDLLEFSRINSPIKKIEQVAISTVLGQVISNLQQMITEHSALITNDDLPVVKVAESQILRVFQNLIENAIKFKKKTELPKIHISCKMQNNMYQFSITDNGIGMDMQYHDRVFIVFQRLHSVKEYPGTGIGLSICKRIVERHGGSIWFESKVNEGTTFYFTIPV